MARNAGYVTTLIVLFLDSIEQSLERVAIRAMQQSGSTISESNVTLNFNESFKNIANYYFYFDKSDFIYTGSGGENRPIMTFEKNNLLKYHRNNLQYPQRFAHFAFSKKRLNEGSYNIIITNTDFPAELK